MYSLRTLLSVAAISSIVCTTICAQAKTKVKANPRKSNITIGFQVGKSLSAPLYSQRNNQNNILGTNHKFLINKPVTQHIKVEAGIDYYQPNNHILYPVSGPTFLNSKNPNTLSVPLSVDYYFLPKQCKLHPWCGVGLQYTNNLNSILQKQLGDAIATPPSPVQQAGTKYVSILFTQGVTFEVNTKIQVIQSIHLVQSNNEKTFGLNIGIGFKLP